MQKRRYPGVSPFTGEQQHIFFGRTEDIKKLHKLIQLRNQVLLYSKSGIGKTSLLNAGVLPLLIAQYETLNIRFTAYDEKSFVAPVDNVIHTLRNFLKEKLHIDLDKKPVTEIDEFFKDESLPKTLWYYFKKIQISECTGKKFILVFDQFEELFSYPDEMQRQFKEQLSELTRILIPNALIEKISANIKDIDQQDQLIELFSEKMDIKTVFAIRSDRLSSLNSLSDKIPDIQEVFYELKPLTYTQVEDAIVKPALEKNDAFEIPAFEYLPQTVETIINELSENRKQTIETTQLQIVCQQIEDIAKQKSEKSLSKDKIQIEAGDLPKFDAIFFHFYDQAVKKLEENLHKKARLLIEDQLIRNNQRISLDENICTDYLNKDDLNTLVSTHLLRAERNSIVGISYELSHDTLVTPISDAHKKRMEKEEEERAEAERREELRIAKEKAEKECIEREKEKRQQRKIITIVSIAAVVAIGLAVFGLVMWRKADESLNKADKLIRFVANASDSLKVENYFELFHKNCIDNLIKGKESEAKRNFEISLLAQDVPEGYDSSYFTLYKDLYVNLIHVEGGRICLIDDLRDYHFITLSNFSISKYEITNAQYAIFLNEYSSEKVKTGEYKNEMMIYEHEWGVKKTGHRWNAQTGYENYPVMNVTWFGANEFCKFYGGQLPTEVQWEYAARGRKYLLLGKDFVYAGSNNIDSVAWYNGISITHPEGTGTIGTKPIGGKKPNLLGIYDMSGNVNEWCSDWYGDYTNIKDSLLKNMHLIEGTDTSWVNIDNGSERVLRGGAYNDFALFCEVSYRNKNTPDYHKSSLGFRFVLLTSSKQKNSK
jgi:formylglycine-generating enzyme required for sulfatase activity